MISITENRTELLYWVDSPIHIFIFQVVCPRNYAEIPPNTLQSASVNASQTHSEKACILIGNIFPLVQSCSQNFSNYYFISCDDLLNAPMDFSNKEFIQGDVDVMSAYLSNQPYLMKEQGIDINIINPLNYGVGFYGDNLYATEQELALHPKRAKMFLEASLKGWKYALEHKDETISVLRAKYNTKRTPEHLMY